MSEKDQFIDNIVKGMMDNKRSLVQRYGKNAEKIAFGYATKKWEEKMEKENIKENENVSQPFGVSRSGGQIGLKSGIVKTFDTYEEAKEYASRMNKQLSPGEKEYYKIKYKAVKTKTNESSLKELIRKTINEQKKVVNSKSYIEKKSLQENIKELTDEEYKIAKAFAAKVGGQLAATGADDTKLYISVQLPKQTDETEYVLDKQGNEIKEGLIREASNPELDKKVKSLILSLSKLWDVKDTEVADAIKVSLKRLGY